jgi:8-oxo-dGTP pyrophosphatase MutT (NUDIX family)
MGRAGTKTLKIAVRQQFGVLPYRETKKAGLEILLVTSRETRRWIVPKGWPIKGLKPAESAAREAYEEAGLRGATSSRSLGSYVYDKRLVEKHTTVPCEVKVYPMRVRRQEAAWPERAERDTLWFSPAAAIAAVSEGGLKAIIAAFARVGEETGSIGSKPKIKRK